MIVLGSNPTGTQHGHVLGTVLSLLREGNQD
jgi:hypothetical protein